VLLRNPFFPLFLFLSLSQHRSPLVAMARCCAGDGLQDREYRYFKNATIEKGVGKLAQIRARLNRLPPHRCQDEPSAAFGSARKPRLSKTTRIGQCPDAGTPLLWVNAGGSVDGKA
jgi:hypothetical protein